MTCPLLLLRPLRMSEAYDALLLLSFGGPEGPDEVMPFLENVTRGRNIPRERLLGVAEHYQHFGGVSPINEQNRQLIAALQNEVAQHNIALPIYWGNRNWHPLLSDTLAQMKREGKRRALAFFTSAFSSYSGCRQYRENVAAAQATVGNDPPQIEKLRVFYNHPGFIEPMIERTQAALDQLSSSVREQAVLVFTAHSVPMAMATTSKYVEQLNEAARLVASAFPSHVWQLVYQSRSGPPSQPWLEPDINDHLRALAGSDTKSVVIIPIGFISDHMEVMYDLDYEARAVSDSLGLSMVRAGTVGTHPQFVSMIRELIEERLGLRTERRALGSHGPSHDVCPIDCCPAPQRPTGPPGRSGAA